MSFSNVRYKNSVKGCTVDFKLSNESNSEMLGITVDVIINHERYKRLDIDHIRAISASYYYIDISGVYVTDSDTLELIVSELYNKKGSWAHWTNITEHKQTNTLYSEFYADAPWRMKKTDDAGNLMGIPVHFFLHDADLVPLQDLKIDNINIRIKNASDPGFGSVLTFDTLNNIEFQDLFSCYSDLDLELDIKQFELNSFVTSSTQTIDFNINSDFIDEYVQVSDKYWYFTFNIPPSVLQGYNDIVDVLVQIEYANFSITDGYVGMRVFRTNEVLPQLNGFYRGDTHLHSMYTQNDAEIGLPLCATKEAAKRIGIDWITTTDHTSDFDNYGVAIASNWSRIQNEAQQLNATDSTLIYIAGQEVAVNNSNAKLVHMLAYPKPEAPFSLPFIGDGNGDIYPTTVNVNNALNLIDGNEGFAYAAHPFATEDELPAVPVNGGIWNLGTDQFPLNGNAFPITGGAIICNTTGIASDVFYSNLTSDTLIHPGLSGAQIWNTRHTLESTADEMDAWDVQNVGGGMSQMDTSALSFHWKRFRQGQEIVNIINQIGLQRINTNAQTKNWKMYYSAGTDAHGSFNFSNTDDFASLGSITNNAVGKMSTAAYCPNGMGMDGVNILTSLKNGKTTLTDGPMLAVSISKNGDDGTGEIFMGEDSKLDINYIDQHYLNLDISTTDEFGKITGLWIYLGMESGEFGRKMTYTDSMGYFQLTYNLADVLDSIINGFSLPNNEFMYIRAEIETHKDYSTQSAEYRTSFDTFHSVTNPIWFKYDDLTQTAELDARRILIYPNPAGNNLHIQFSSPLMEAEYEIIDQYGRLYKKGKLEEHSIIELNDLDAGMYTIVFELNGTIERAKFIHLN